MQYHGFTPYRAVGLSLADNVSHLTAMISLVGHRLHTAWQTLTHGSARLTTALQRLVVPVSAWLLSQGVALGAGVLYLILSVLLLFFKPARRVRGCREGGKESQ